MKLVHTVEVVQNSEANVGENSESARLRVSSAQVGSERNGAGQKFFKRHKHSLGRLLVSLFLLFHIGSLVLASLPWSPFVASLFPYYSWYIKATSQQQGWGMYQYPTQADMRYEFIAVMPDGSVHWPVGRPEDVTPRQLYILEGLLSSHGRYADQFMTYVREQYPSGKEPVRMEMRYLRASVAPLTVHAPESGYRGEFQQQKQLVRSWR